jgi:hypothetical protein
MKYLPILLLVVSCKHNFKRIVTKQIQPIYYKVSVQKDNSLNHFVAFSNAELALSSINKSEFEYEIRVHYIYSFGQTYFRHGWDGNQNYIFLSCGVSFDRNDSSFINFPEKVEVFRERKFDYGFSFNMDSSYNGFKVDSSETVLLDNISDFVIQIKEHKQVRYFYFTNNKMQKNDIENKLLNFVHKIEKVHNFQFYTDSKKILETGLTY